MSKSAGFSPLADIPQAEPWEVDAPKTTVVDTTNNTQPLVADNLDDTDDFPVKMFPRFVTDLVFALNQIRLFPIGFATMAILFTVSVLVGKCACLVTSLGRTMANLYIAFVAPKGEDKTRPIEWATAPLVQLDREAREEYLRKKKEFNLAKDNGTPDVFPPECPRRYIMCDATDEAVLRQLHLCADSMGLRRDELMDLLRQSSRYTERSSDLYLSLFSGASIEVDRATKDDVYFINAPVISIIGGIQPDRLLRAFKGDRMDSGLFDRFLVVSRHGYTAKPWNLEGYVPDNLDAEYNQLVIRRLIDSAAWHGDYHLAPEAEIALQNWQNDEEYRLEREGSDLQYGIFRKTQVYALKFALMLQILSDLAAGATNPDHIVSGENAIRATVIADYFYHGSTSLAEDILHPVLGAKEKMLLDMLPDTFSAKDGLEKAKTLGIGKTAYYGLLGKANGALLERVRRGIYAKKYMGVPIRRSYKS